MLVRRLWPMVLIGLLAVVCPASVEPIPARVAARAKNVSERSRAFSLDVTVHGSEFAAMTHPASWHECEAVQPPKLWPRRISFDRTDRMQKSVSASSSEPDGRCTAPDCGKRRRQ